jgi:hypothetical protein
MLSCFGVIVNLFFGEVRQTVCSVDLEAPYCSTCQFLRENDSYIAMRPWKWRVTLVRSVECCCCPIEAESEFSKDSVATPSSL